LLRDYQSHAVDALRESLRTSRAVCLQLPTGAGKTPIVAEITASAFQRDFRVWFVVPRNELLTQASEHFKRWDIPHAYISAGMQESRAFKIHVVSKDTLLRRLDRIKNWPDLLIFDEAHIALDAQIKILTHVPTSTKIIGMTATPERLDGRGLSEVYDECIYGPSIPWLTDRGFLSPLRYFAPPIEGLQDVHRKGNEYDADELDDLFKKRHVYGSVIEYYREYGKRPDSHNKSALIFCRSVKSAYETAERFREAGFRFECIEGAMSDKKRRDMIGGLKDGRLDGLTNCEIATYGLDVPRVEYGASIRPTLSRALYFQMVGRILRPFDGKSEAVFFDHANLVQEHQDISAPGVPLFYLDNITWNFAGRDKRPCAATDSAVLKLCPLAGYIYCDKTTCVGCEHRDPSVIDPRRAALPVVEATLTERTATQSWTTLAPEEKREVQDRIGRATERLRAPGDVDIEAVADLLAIADELGRQPMWAYHLVSEGRATVNVSLVHAIAKVKGYKPGWVWFKITELRKGRVSA
jgi:superfamily II DNA or RNA helicase